MKPIRFKENPLIWPNMDPQMGTNINGPSLIKVPGWVTNPLGRYYLYFAHHQGDYIRLAYADRLEGPWKTHPPGTLQLAESYCPDHIASPDVHVDDKRKEIRMYYHGLDKPLSQSSRQITRVATSKDGLHFTCSPEILGVSYFRVFQWRGWYYALGMPGIFYRSVSGLSHFEQGPTLFTDDMRHSALKLEDDILFVFYSNVGDKPEHIVLSTIDLSPDWMTWQATAPISVLQPELDYEGAHLPLKTSIRGWAPEPVRQLRDPAIYQELGQTYLFYSVAGERGIAIAKVE